MPPSQESLALRARSPPSPQFHHLSDAAISTSSITDLQMTSWNILTDLLQVDKSGKFVAIC